jgi:hypothetical protein
MLSFKSLFEFSNSKIGRLLLLSFVIIFSTGLVSVDKINESSESFGNKVTSWLSFLLVEAAFSIDWFKFVDCLKNVFIFISQFTKNMKIMLITLGDLLLSNFKIFCGK